MAQAKRRFGRFDRRGALSIMLGAAIAPAFPAAAQARIYDMHISRDVGCGCCSAWADLMRRSGRFRVSLSNEADMGAVKRRLGVPLELASCHTASVGAYAIEGHVPVADILRLIESPPTGVRGIAVPGMPLGSPGMEAGSQRDAFDVIAFAADGTQQVFARYAARR